MTDFELHPPATAGEIAEVERHLERPLPIAYRRFLLEHDGGEGFWGESYLILWRVGALIPYNRDYEVATYAPGLFIFGSNGGGEAFAFDLREPSTPIKVVPFIGMSHDDALPLAPDFDAFLIKLETDGIL